MWGIVTIVIAAVLSGLGVLSALLGMRIGTTFNISQQLSQLQLNSMIPFTVLVFATGIVANDVRDGWLRTLLIRPITRGQYLTVKMAAAYVSIVAVLIVSGTVPVIIGAMTTSQTVEFDAAEAIVLWVILLIHTLLLLSLLTFLSCWMKGFLNVAFLAGWAMASAMIGAYVQFTKWDDKWMTIGAEFLFPSGFFDAAGSVVGGTLFPVDELLWGLSALAGFLALAYWGINAINVDKQPGSE
jgi:ABC-type transport system involved in multi-copper enzyme maturation permease subunit